MVAMSNYLEGQLIDHLFRTNTFAKPTVIAIALSSSTTTDATTGSTTLTEPATANNYARQSLAPLDANWAAPSGNNGTTSNQSVITYPACQTADWGPLTDLVVADNATRATGNAWFWGLLTVAKTITVGDIFKFQANQLVIQLDN